MKKILSIFLIAVFLLVSIPTNQVDASSYVPVATFVFTENSNKFNVDNMVKSLYGETFTQSNTLFVPLRNVIEEVGGSISWNGKEKSISIVLNDLNVNLKINSNYAYVNKKEVKILLLILKNSRSFISLKDLANLLNGTVVSENSIEIQKQLAEVFDTTGRKIKVPVKISKIVSLNPMVTLFVFPLKMQDKLIATPTAAKVINKTNFEKVFPNLSNLKDGSDFKNPNVETILSLKPDVVISSSGTPVQKLEEVGIPIALLSIEDTHTMLKSIQFLGTILGRTKEATDTLVYLDSKLAFIKSKTDPIQKKKTVYFALGRLTQSAGTSLMQNDMIERASGVSVTKDIKGGKIDVSIEQILSFNPDYIIVAPYSTDSVESILSNSVLSGVNAVKNKNVYKMPQFLGSYDLPEPEVILGIMWLSDVLYGNSVNFDMKKEAKEFYSKIFNYNLTDADLKYIFP